MQNKQQEFPLVGGILTDEMKIGWRLKLITSRRRKHYSCEYFDISAKANGVITQVTLSQKGKRIRQALNETTGIVPFKLA